MAALTLGPARGLSHDDLTRLLNRAFADYVVPMQVTPSDLAAIFERDDVLLDASYVAYRDGEPLGAALVAVRPWHRTTRSRLATMGVVPEGRRQGVGRALLRRVVEAARARGSQSVLLEVFAGNAPARRLYEGHGFVPRRRLLGFSLGGAALRGPDARPVGLRPIDGRMALALFSACTIGEAPEAAPPWQLDAPVLVRFGPPTALYGVEPAGAAGPVGYLVVGAARPVANLVHLGIVPAWRRRGVATAALVAALQRHPDIAGFYVPQLVPAASPLVPFLQALGARRGEQEQIEMELPIG